MTRFKSAVLISLLSLLSFSRAEAARLTPEQFRQHFARIFVQDFVHEFNTIHPDDSKQLYGLLFPKKARKAILSWQERPTLKADGTTIVIEGKGFKPVRLEVVDLFEQKYKINGRIHKHDWNGDPLVDLEVVKRKLQPSSASLIDLLLPPSEANPAVVAAPVAEVAVGAVVAADAIALAEAVTALEATGMSTAAATAAATTGEAATVASTQAGIANAIRATGKAIQLIEENPEFRAKILQDLLEKNQLLLERSAAALENSTKALQQIEKAIRPPSPGLVVKFLKALGDKSFQAALQVSGTIGGFVTLMSVSHNLGWMTALQCYLIGTGDPQLCTQAVKAAAPKGSPLDNPPKQYTCNDPKSSAAVDTSGYFEKKDGKKDVYSIRFGTPDVNNGSLPVSGVGFIVDAEGKVEPDSIRKFSVKMDKERIFITGMQQVILAPGAKLTEADMIVKPDLNIVDSAAVQADEAERFKKRDKKLEELTKQEVPVPDPRKIKQSYDGLFKDFHEDPSIADKKSDLEQKELGKAAEFTALYQIIQGGCNHNDLDPKLVSAASAPAADTAIKQSPATTK